ncbi:MAG: hypothetical protein ACXABK_01555 [Candidatus Heimdallarchaeaceae archaeon]
MGIQNILPPKEEQEEEIVLIHRNGLIIALNNSVYQVKLYREPERRIFTTSIENAFNFLQNNDNSSQNKEEFYIK